MKPCKDCVAQGVTTMRPAPHPGPRCVTHHRARKAAVRARTHESHVGRTFALAPGDYERLKAAQGGRCAICQWSKGISRALPVDHDHECCPGAVSCGRCVRGLLCTNCNRWVVSLGPDGLKRALEYLANPPAQQVLR